MASLAASLGLLERLIAFDTTSRNSNLALIEFIRDYLAGHGVACDLIYNEGRTKANLLARIGPDAPGGILLSGHTDVVPVDGQDWKSDPFTLTQKDNLLYGRGTSDMKSFAACLLAMVPEFAGANLAAPIYLAFSYDEEVGCLGAPSLAGFLQSQNLTPRLAIIGEPTEMRVVTAHKGIHSFETVITAHEAHSSAPENGVNAVLIGAKLVTFLDRLAAETRINAPHNHFDPPYTTIHVGVMKGGTARNIIPGECRICWEIRPLPEENTAALIARFEAYAAELEQEMQARFPETSIRTQPLSSVIGLTRADDLPEAELLHLAETNHADTAAFTTEAGIFQQHGIPAIVCGPGSIAEAHKPNEFIAISQVEACLAFLARLLGMARERRGLFGN